MSCSLRLQPARIKTAAKVAVSTRGAFQALQRVAANVTASAQRALNTIKSAGGTLVKHVQAAFNDMKEKIERLFKAIQDLNWGQILQSILKYLKKNPKITLLQLALLLVAIYPPLFLVLVLFVLGFGTAGPIAGSLAAGFQSIFGTPAPFPILQSIAMGGSALPIVHGIIAAIAVTAIIALEVYKWKHDYEEEGDKKQA